ncbi:MAG: AlkA N-terminal domain-containing protein, partial [Bdellovibrionales bacterium]|nr:AlkA N-terminal domain-containing protein [Bdellovibrionales bacterium]
DGLIKTYESHRVGELEWFKKQTMHRVVVMNEKIGQVAISNQPANSCLMVEIDFPDTSAVHSIITKVRNLFDVDSDPVIIANSLEQNSRLKRALRQFPGIRLPSGWDPFEVAIATILGQLVSIDRGRTLVADLIEIAGEQVTYSKPNSLDKRTIRLFPTAKQICEADLNALKTTNARKQTLLAFAKAIDQGDISLEPTQDIARFIRNALSIKGIGPWTAQYMALKALRDTDAFPSSDLILARALEHYSPETFEFMRPWRGYAAALLWRAHGAAGADASPIKPDKKRDRSIPAS